MSPYEFINDMFRAKTAKSGGIVRRKVASVQTYASLQYLIKEVEARGFHLIETGNQYVVICNPGNFRLLR